VIPPPPPPPQYNNYGGVVILPPTSPPPPQLNYGAVAILPPTTPPPPLYGIPIRFGPYIPHFGNLVPCIPPGSYGGTLVVIVFVIYSINIKYINF
jgi:hypothetical protein